MFPVLFVLAAVISLPAWSYARRHQGASWLLLTLAVPATLVWVLLTGAGVGAQSLSNLVEMLVLLLLSVVSCYVQVFVLDRYISKPFRTSAWLAGGLALVAVVLRVSMPVLPE